jgi:hypothetical protein
MHVPLTRLLSGLLLVCGMYYTTFAQQMNVELKDLSLGADVIITGKVTQLFSSWNDDNTRIYTRATIQVDEYLKGINTENSIIVTYPGGEVGEIGEKYSHMPTFQNNEEVLVFLKKNVKSSDYKVYNGENGKISVINDPKTGERVTTSNVQINSLKAQIKNYVND